MLTQHKLVLRINRLYLYISQSTWHIMKRRVLLVPIVLMLATHAFMAQVAPDCAGAIPICSNTPVNGGTQGFGTDDFYGETSSGCLEQTLSGAIESNSAWYHFRTGASGQLGFNIAADSSEDWDFALYRSGDCGNLGTPVRCNFFDNSSQEVYTGVGEPPGGNGGSVLYDDWLQVSAGEDYYLLINNFSNTNSGFSIQFTGQIFQTNPGDALDCSIISNLLGPPVSACDTDIITLDATTPNALAYNWYADDGSGFQLLPGNSGPILLATQPALYRVEVVTPSETIYSDVQVGFSPAPTTYPVTDVSICAQNGNFDLRTKDSEALGSQDPGLYAVSYHHSAGDAQAGLNPLPVNYPLLPGSETIFVRTVSVANPYCYDSSRQFNLSVAEPPLLDFPVSVAICEDSGAVTIGDTTPDPDYAYAWDNGAQTAAITITASGTYTVEVTNSQGGAQCSETLAIQVELSVSPVIGNIIITDLRESNTVEVQAAVAGNFEYRLNNGPSQESNMFTDVPAGLHTITVSDPRGCGAVQEDILVMGYPKFFTPNGDGSNDLWQIQGIEMLNNPQVFIYDRFGKLISQLDSRNPGWDGTFKGLEMPSSDYWFRLTYTDSTGQDVEARYLSSHFSLKR